MKLLLGWAINAVALFLLPYLVPAVQVRGFGTALVTAVTETGFLIGADRLYLCAAPAKSAFYERFGWRMTEADVDGLDILEKSA